MTDCGGVATKARIDSLMREVDPGPEALEYLYKENPEPEKLLRVLKLMRLIEIEEAQKQKEHMSAQ